ncbi:MAG: ThiF family adenylyltransferase [Candidatus Lokiarchaeota archaeon]|nr:ThiF family adenylyltransferase [Candidatus Lokiarchaeota archaeon]
MVENNDQIFKSRMFARQQLIEGWDQQVLEDACVLIIGVGALGCEIAKDFALMGIGKLVLVDLDTVETSNLSRQMLFRAGDEGRPKAEVAAQRLKEMNPYLKVEYHFEKLQKLPMSVYEEADVVIAALDNFNARLDLNKICLNMKKPMIEGGTVGFEGHIQIVIPKGAGIAYKDKELEIDKIVETELWYLDEEEYPEYFEAERMIGELEEKIEKLRENIVRPIISKIRSRVEEEFDEKHAPELLDQTPCYRCVVPIPPPDDKLVAACTLKGLPRNRNHCVIKAEVDYEKIHGKKPDLTVDDQVVELKKLAQEQLEQLRERVFKENVAEEKMTEMSPEEIQEWKNNIKETFGPDYKFEEMENILGNKIAAIQSVSSIISSLETQEALKILFRVKGRDIGPPMDPPYLNYNGVYGLFEGLNITKRDDCLACGNIKGEENVQIVLEFNANIAKIFWALKQIEIPLNQDEWMIINPVTKEIYWDPNSNNPIFKDLSVPLQAELKLRNNDTVTLTPVGNARLDSEIKKYNVVIQFM